MRIFLSRQNPSAKSPELCISESTSLRRLPSGPPDPKPAPAVGIPGRSAAPDCQDRDSAPRAWDVKALR